MEVVHEKLVRDNIPKIIEKSGKKSIIEIMENEEYIKELNKKLIEETEEYLEEESIEEIADILEVIHSILKVKGITLEEVEKIRKDKKKERGGFDKKIKLIKVISKNK